MNKQDLINLANSNGDKNWTVAVVELKSGCRCLVVGNILLDDNGFECLDKYGDDLKHSLIDSYSIVKVFAAGKLGRGFEAILKNPYNLIWERKNHTITIDGKEIELSEESFNNLKKQLLEG